MKAVEAKFDSDPHRFGPVLGHAEHYFAIYTA